MSTASENPVACDSTGFSCEIGGFLIEHGGAAPGFQGGPQCVKGGKRASLVRVYEDSDIHDVTANASFPGLASDRNGTAVIYATAALGATTSLWTVGINSSNSSTTQNSPS